MISRSMCKGCLGTWCSVGAVVLGVHNFWQRSKLRKENPKEYEYDEYV